MSAVWTLATLVATKLTALAGLNTSTKVGPHPTQLGHPADQGRTTGGGRYRTGRSGSGATGDLPFVPFSLFVLVSHRTSCMGGNAERPTGSAATTRMIAASLRRWSEGTLMCEQTSVQRVKTGETEVGDWTAEAEPAVLLCQDWAKSVQAAAKVRLYLFGSAIYKGGEQFDRYTSDIDIVAVLPPELDPADRVDTLEELRKHKVQLELNMIPALERRTCDEAGVSLVPITPLELRTNVHKSGARRFFEKNFFLDLSSGAKRVGLPDAGVATLPDENRAALEYVQKVRNQYLGQSANLCGGLGPYSGADPMPKALLRFAAQLDPAAEEGEWYDTRRGLRPVSS